MGSGASTNKPDAKEVWAAMEKVEDLNGLVSSLSPEAVAKLTAALKAGADTAVMKQRVAFTARAEQAMKEGEGTTKAVVEEIAEARKATTMEVRGELAKGGKPAIAKTTRLTLLQEQLGTARGLPANWENELKFHEKDGKCTASCGGLEFEVGSDFSEGAMLVVSPLVRTARKTFFEAKTSGKMLMFKGPAGTGKTETFKDICRELGVNPCISSFSEGAASAEDVKKALASGKYVCLDFCSVESMAPDVVSALPGFVKESGSFVCVSCNAETLKGSEDWADACVVLDFTLPPLAPIWDALLSCEGFVGSEKLGDKLAACMEAVKASEFFKKDEKDKMLVGLANSMVQAMGQAARVTDYDDEDKIVGQQAFKSMLSIMEEAGKDSLKGLVKEHLGVEAV